MKTQKSGDFPDRVFVKSKSKSKSKPKMTLVSAAFSNSSSVVWTGNKWYVFAVKNAVFRFLQRTLDRSQITADQAGVLGALQIVFSHALRAEYLNLFGDARRSMRINWRDKNNLV